MNGMDQWHKSLVKRHAWYKQWHSVPFISALHFLMLAGVGSFIALTLQTAFLTADANHAQASTVTIPLGSNLGGVNYYSSEDPFLNVFKGGIWYTQKDGAWDTNEEDKLNLDSNGYPKCICGVNGQAVTFTRITTFLATTEKTHPGGKYVVLYEGEGTIIYGLGASKDVVASVPGRDVVNFDRDVSGLGFILTITATDPNKTGNYIRNIRVVYAPYESLLTSGEIFNPMFIERIKPFKTLRFMDWMQTNGSTEGVSWAQRALTSTASWANPNPGGAAKTTKSVPVEVMVALANKLQADPWFNMPHLSTPDYITQFATLVHQQLAGTQKVYVEFSNETWNYQFAQTQWAQAQGLLMWPNATSGFSANLNYTGMRVAQMCDIWKQVWGADANRVVCVLASQAANPTTASNALACSLWTAGAPCAKHGINAVAIAPYFGGNIGPDIGNAAVKAVMGNNTLAYYQLTVEQKAAVDSYISTNYTVDYVINAATPLLDSQTGAWTAANKTIANQYGLSLIAYEGGPHLVAGGGLENSVPLANLLMSSNRDPRMGTLVTNMLQKWSANGGGLFAYFSDIGPNSKWGSWGALEYVTETHTPKYDALINYINSGTVTPPPAAPTATLSANPTSITSGQSTTLTWASTNATSCIGTGFSTSATGGSQTVSPSATTAYSVTCTGAGGSASASATVAVSTVVTPPPPPPPPPNKFIIGDRVRTTDKINVRQGPAASGKPAGQQKGGVLGTVIAGPKADSSLTWWQIDFDAGADGWVAEPYLTK